VMMGAFMEVYGSNALRTLVSRVEWQLMTNERYPLRPWREAREAANYNPWGRGGAGAPMKDNQGNVVTSLMNMRQANNQVGGCRLTRGLTPG